MTGVLRVAATQGDCEAEASVQVVVSENTRRDGDGFGIPEPELLDEPNGLWWGETDPRAGPPPKRIAPTQR
jgi:hypothetical protein